MFMEHDLRNWLWEFFPNLRFFNEPITDDSIIGVALINDDGPHWVAVYEESLVMTDLRNYFFNENGDEDTSDEDALEWYNYNVLGSYIGKNTPVFMHDYSVGECAASRFNKYYETYIILDDTSSIEEAIDIITEKDTMLYVPLEQVEQINNYS